MFIKTKEYLEFEEDMKELLHIFKNPVNVVRLVYFSTISVIFYFVLIILADLVKGVL